MSMMTRISPSLKVHALPLRHLGLDDVAWSREYTREVLNAIKDADIAVLGGDVFRERGGHLVHTYDNWHCERDVAESLANYARRSWQYAWDYVAKYPENKAEQVYFSLVTSDEPTAGL